MSAVFAFLRKFLTWLRARFVRRYQTRWVYDMLPDSLDVRTVYVVQDEDVFWHVSFLCPCGCKAILHMNLIPDEHPFWRLTKHKDGTISLFPSIWRQTGCHSHFWLREGRIIWTPTSENTPF